MSTESLKSILGHRSDNRSVVDKWVMPVLFVIVVTILAIEMKQIQANVPGRIPLNCFEVQAFQGFDKDGNVLSKTEEMCTLSIQGQGRMDPEFLVHPDYKGVIIKKSEVQVLL